MNNAKGTVRSEMENMMRQCGRKRAVCNEEKAGVLVTICFEGILYIPPCF